MGPRGAGMLRVFQLQAWAAAGEDLSAPVKAGTGPLTAEMLQALRRGPRLERFRSPLVLTIRHTEEELRGLDLDTLGLYHLDEETGRWLPVPSRFDRESLTLTAEIEHFSFYGEHAEPVISGPGHIMAFQTDLHSGAAVASYPLELPPARGGFGPSLALSYSSARVDEMKNKRSVGSWVGIGWDLSLGSIRYEEASDTCYLDLNGVSYELVNTNGNTYRTDPESFYRIIREGQTWHLYDREGNHYRFGGTADSKQYYRTDEGKVFYRWDLSYAESARGDNSYTISYVQDEGVSGSYSHIRAAYPQRLRYNDGRVEVIFNSSYDELWPWGTGAFRADTPRDPIPKVIETRHLDSIEVKAGGELVRKYVFTYESTPYHHSNDYGGIDYAGTLVLQKVTEYGANGTSSLPAMRFFYQTRQVRLHDTDEQDYSGNPGNPAELFWPYLVRVKNGYGAEVRYTYEQLPSATADDVWTRQVVTRMETDPGIGEAVTTDYEYFGGPEYHERNRVHEWEDEYRGFARVWVADAEGNYTEHYFHTTGTADEEVLTGREYRVEEYASTEGADPWGMRARWSLDEGTGAAAHDEVGRCDGTVHGASWTAHEGGYALSFDGVDDYVKISHPGDLRLPTIRISAWVYPRTLDGVNPIVALETTTSANRGAMLSLKEGMFRMFAGVGSAKAHVRAAVSQPNRWYHVVGEFDGTEVRLWVDGELRASEPLSGSLAYDTSRDMRIGSWYLSWTTRYADAVIDQVEVGPPGQTSVVKTHFVYLSEVSVTEGERTARTAYEYDDYGNVDVEYHYGDTDDPDDDFTVHRAFRPNTEGNILSLPARVRLYQGIVAEDSGGAALRGETLYYYDGAGSWETPPAAGNLTRTDRAVGDGTWVTTLRSYDRYGNVTGETDPNGNTWTTEYEATYHTFPSRITAPTGDFEEYTFDPGTGNLLSRTDVNGEVTTYQYDTFGRLTKVIRPGDTASSPTERYLYVSWGTLGEQHLERRTKTGQDEYLWSREYFDGLGRVIQVHSPGDEGKVILSATKEFDSRGLLSRVYLAQERDAAAVSGYLAPEPDWRSASYAYDALGRVTSETGPDGATVSYDYSVPWQTVVTNPRGYKHRYHYDAFGRLVQVDELGSPDDPEDTDSLYAVTTYRYDVRGNLVQVTDAHGNVTTMTYDWLSRKTAMTDPDMGSWSYQYNPAGNLVAQTDARGQTITLTYDSLGRVTAKHYPQGSGTADVLYFYDDTSDGNHGKGRRTRMVDAGGEVTYRYDERGRLVEERRSYSGVDYVTTYTYDPADRLVSVTYPTGETVTQDYDGRGLPFSLVGSQVGTLVSAARYNEFGRMTSIDLGNGARTTYEYWALDHTDPGLPDESQFGRLWRIRTAKGEEVLQDIYHQWDQGGNLTLRYQLDGQGQTVSFESFSYDFLDRLIEASDTAGVSPYHRTYTYDELGNILSLDGEQYTYGDPAHVHAVTQAGATTYQYDACGNMTRRGDQTLSWNAENRLVSVAGPGTASASFVYDGDGYRLLKTDAGETILYVNRYYEKNLTTGEETCHYYLGGKQVAYRKGEALEYPLDDHLFSTAGTMDSDGNKVSTVKYFPFGETRFQEGEPGFDKRFTGQRLDRTGLYYYGARYYDAGLGRFISPDTIVPDPANPQSLNRYSYCLNNPLKYVDPTGHQLLSEEALENISLMAGMLRSMVQMRNMTAAMLGDSPELRAMDASITAFADAIGAREYVDSQLTPLGSQRQQPQLSSPAEHAPAAEVTFKDVYLFARRPNLVTLVAGSKYGTVDSHMKLSGKASVTATDGGLRQVWLSIEGETGSPHAYGGGASIRLDDPELVIKGPKGERRLEMAPIPCWDRARPANQFAATWGLTGPDIPLPSETDTMYIQLQTYVPMDNRTIEEAPAYMEPYGLRIDLVSGQIETLQHDTHL